MRTHQEPLDGHEEEDRRGSYQNPCGQSLYVASPAVQLEEFLGLRARSDIDSSWLLYVARFQPPLHPVW
ncbi:MAG: hypothetical protein JRH14_18350 [Deltaproteobacteria bacterium]|nr:hypothetical protein [Deltaproteobacteria bacterium]MBW2161897.1 hypothetical protein [Deltaproteobacteria bacterium]